MHESTTLGSSLSYAPEELKFGTSGRRGEVIHLTQLEIYINATAELEYLQSLPAEEGGIARGDEFYLAYDLRPSSTSFSAAERGRGELFQAIERAVTDAGMRPVNLGAIPTPALTFHAISRRKGSIMVTGSHIPFDRNGYKVNTAAGELLKEHEAPITARVKEVRARVYATPLSASLFNEQGMLREGHRELPPSTGQAETAYLDRYASFFEGQSLKGMRLLVFQHSAVGRDLLVRMVERFGAEAIPAGRSETFIPIDTENIEAAQLRYIQQLLDAAASKHGPIDAVISTDGDSDRPLLLGVEPATARARFLNGDLVGMIVAGYLGADAVVVPISCNDGIDRGNLAPVLEPKTKIGSPYVIAGMEVARRKGRMRICGWEANGGFLLGSDFERKGKILKALPTRDAMLPVLTVLFAAREQGVRVEELFQSLPRRYSRSALLKNFPRAAGRALVERFAPAQGEEAAKDELRRYFTRDEGFGDITAIDYTDGVRIRFSNGDVAHFRPSGNADELRIYAAADSQERADNIAALGIREPDGILRAMERDSKF